MNVKDFVVGRIKQLKEKAYTPRFKAGDVIINERDKIIRRIREVKVWPEDKTGFQTEYIMSDIENPLADPRHKTYPRTKKARNIDIFYKLVDPKTADILYGKS